LIIIEFEIFNEAYHYDRTVMLFVCHISYYSYSSASTKVKTNRMVTNAWT